MEAAHWVLGVGIVSVGLFSGLLMTVVFLLHPMFRAMSGPDFATTIERFLAVARVAPINWAMVLVSPAAMIAAIVLLAGEDGTTTPLVLTIIALVSFFLGPFLTSNRLAEPLYDVMVGWDNDAPPDDWKTVQRRYFVINYVRLSFCFSAFVALVAALGTSY